MASYVQPEVAVAWEPWSAPQEALLACPVQDVFYGGARGGGKTDALLGDFAAHAGQYGDKAAGIIFRRTYSELEEVEKRSRAIYTLLWGPDAYNASKRIWTATNGATLKLRYLDNDADASRYQGHSYTWQGWDELTNWPQPEPIDKLLATLRSAHGVPCYRRSTGNPGGPGHSWVKQRYIDPAPDGYRTFRYCPNPKSRPDVTVNAVFIPSKLDDNPRIAEGGYEDLIAAAAGENDALYQAWRHGRWDVFVGQMYSEFKREFHVITNKRPEDFPAGTSWFATLDWGHTRGCYGLHAVDDEDRIELVWEFYDPFTKLTAEEAAIAIAHASRDWPVPKIIHADEQMFQKVGTMMTVGEEFLRGLVKAYPKDSVPGLWQAKHPKGSREVKVALIHEFLSVGKRENSRDPAVDDRGKLLPWATPRYRIHDRCKNTIRVLQEIPADPDNPNDVDPKYVNDHPHDMVGFAVASRPPRAKYAKRAEDQKNRARKIDWATATIEERTSAWAEMQNKMSGDPHTQYVNELRQQGPRKIGPMAGSQYGPYDPQR